MMTWMRIAHWDRQCDGESAVCWSWDCYWNGNGGTGPVVSLAIVCKIIRCRAFHEDVSAYLP